MTASINVHHQPIMLLSIGTLYVCPRFAGGQRRGSTLVNVNNRLVPEGTQLDDGDMVILSRDLLTI
jgi:hypothetical protein